MIVIVTVTFVRCSLHCCSLCEPVSFLQFCSDLSYLLACSVLFMADADLSLHCFSSFLHLFSGLLINGVDGYCIIFYKQIVNCLSIAVQIYD